VEARVTALIYCDETKEKGFRLAAAQISCQAVAQVRDIVTALHMPRQVRLHFTSENVQRRKQIITTFASFEDVSAIIYDASGYGEDGKAGRDAAVRQMAKRAALIPAQRIILERDDSVVDQDMAIIRAQLSAAGVEDVVGVDHLRAREDPLLAIPDAIAWCWSKGGEWQKLAEPLIADVVPL
jgi:hypothetical protein